MLPTPSTSHVSFENIYEPAEDSFLLLDTLSNSAESSWLRGRFAGATPSPLVLEVGTGSGIVIAFLAANTKAILGRNDVLTLGVDVNAYACEATEQTVQQALLEQQSSTVYLDSICADLCSAVVDGSVDMLIFNPPYVPTLELPQLPGYVTRDMNGFDRNSHLLSLSYAGGRDGMETTNRLIDSIPQVLSDRGVAYILLCAQNKPDVLKDQVKKLCPGQWNAETVGKSGKFAGWERLEIVRIWRSLDI